MSYLGVGTTGTSVIGTTSAQPSFSANPIATSVTVGTLTITSGAGAPSSSQPQGSLYLRTDGSAVNNRMYVATNSSGTWTAVITAA